MNFNYDPNLNDLNCKDSIFLQFDTIAGPDIQFRELENSDRQVESNSSEINDKLLIIQEPIQSLNYNYYQNDKLFDLTLTENYVLKTEKNPKEEREKSEKKKFKIYKCRYNCGKIFTRERYMNNHVLLMHENVKQTFCKICNIYVSTEARLKNHMLRHSKIKHLICLLCLKKRTKELSCMRHHLLVKHGLKSKHSNFHEAYYQMTLKEIANEHKSKTKDGKKKTKCKSDCTNELQMKLICKAKAILHKFTEADSNNAQNELEKVPIVSGFGKISPNIPKKIITTENGMQLIKLPNGQFKKVTAGIYGLI